MPAGIPVATFAIGVAGAKNAALFAIAMLANQNDSLKQQLHRFRQEQSAKVLNTPLDVS
jgi:5-(carboxyamino)imidazole ribonucleotide mutase